MSVLAIDGPAGAGKTTIARAVAEALGWDYMDTGGMYRAITLAALQRGVAPEDVENLSRIAREVAIDVAGGRITLDGEDVSARIRDADVTRAVPQVAAHPGVRSALVERQRAAARTRDVVMEGRDIGSVVVPEAELKVFLTASLAERARRRSAEIGADEEGVSGVQATIAARDEADSQRAASPLQKAPDAIEIDTTGRSIPEVTDLIVSLVKQRLDGR